MTMIGSKKHAWPWPISRAKFEQEVARNNGRSGLGLLGYRVGTKGLRDLQRKSFLDQFYSFQLPDPIVARFGDKYGPAESADRLQAMAYLIETLVRTRQRNGSRVFSPAICHWRSDYEYLRSRYDAERYMFPWLDLPPVGDLSGQ